MQDIEFRITPKYPLISYSFLEILANLCFIQEFSGTQDWLEWKLKCPRGLERRSGELERRTLKQNLRLPGWR